MKHTSARLKDATAATIARDANAAPVSGSPMDDITGREQAAVALERERRDSQAILDAAPVMIAYKSADDHFVRVNSAFADFVGVPKEAIIGMTTFDLVAQHDVAQRGRDHDLEVIRTGKPVLNQLTKWSGFHSGKEIWAVYSKLPFIDSDGSIVGTVSYVADVDDRVRAEMALRESEYFFRESQRAAFIGSYKTDFTTGFWESSEVLDQIFGIGRDYSRSVRGWLEIVHPDEREAMERYLRDEVIAKRRPFVKEYRIIRKDDGEVRWVNGFGKVSFDADGNILSMIGTIQDVTERKQADAEKASLEGRLQQAQKMESVGRLAGGVAHDFNNMLGVILGHAELAIEQVDPASPLHADLEEIRKAAMRSADLTRQLLAFARKQTVAPKVLVLNELIAGMLTLMHRLIGENVTITWQPEADLWSVKVDPSQIDQILANLCVNARDAIAGVGTLTIETGNRTLDERDCAATAGCAPGEYVMLAVSDNGCGMDKDALSHLFEPFFTTKELGKGTGLGLSTVYGIVQQNHGVINVYSEPNLGTTFRIYLPRHVDHAGQARTAGAARKAPRGQETILVVEDEPAILTLTTRMLEQQGYAVLAAGTPGEALRLAQAHAGEIHLLMSDVVMPEMDGRALAKTLRASCPRLKRLFMSGYTADIIAHHGVLDEGVHFIQKPFSTEALATKVRDALNALT